MCLSAQPSIRVGNLSFHPSANDSEHPVPIKNLIGNQQNSRQSQPENPGNCRERSKNYYEEKNNDCIRNKARGNKDLSVSP